MNYIDPPQNGPGEFQPDGLASSHGSTPLVIRSLGDLVVAVPYMLGFHPEDSLVAVGAGSPNGTCALRLPLPDCGDATALRGSVTTLAGLLAQHAFTKVFLIGYGSEGQVAPIIEAGQDALLDHELELIEALRVQDGLWWSYLCHDPNCCPPEGTPYDISASVVAAEATLQGRAPLASRSELARTIAPLRGASRRSVRRATDRAEKRLLDRADSGASPAEVRALMAEEGIPLIVDLADRVRAGGARATDDEIASLGVLLISLRVRDEAWVRIDEDHLDATIDFWQDVVRRVEQRYAAAPACLLAYAAYTRGDGALANVALDRAEQADPDYSMAQLLRSLITAGVPPDKARVQMSPEELAAAYDDIEDR